MAIFKFLNVGENGENIRYCSNKQDVPAEFYKVAKRMLEIKMNMIITYSERKEGQES